MATPEEFIREARKYLGVPWRHQGRTIHGVDCIGVIIAPLISLGVLRQEDDIHNYKRDPEGRRLVEMLHEHARRLPKVECARPGDLLVLRFTSEPQHLVLVTRATRFGPHVLHAAGQGSVVVEHFLNEHWLRSKRAKIHGAYRLKAFDTEEAKTGDSVLADSDCSCGNRADSQMD
jgi:cell wall-associated NlpC family hydrolase